jgi:hypothetical protein
MNEHQQARQLRRTGAVRRVNRVTRWVAAGAVALAAGLGVLFAQQATGDTEDQGTVTHQDDSGAWQAPGSGSSDGQVHGSTGGS